MPEQVTFNRHELFHKSRNILFRIKIQNKKSPFSYLLRLSKVVEVCSNGLDNSAVFIGSIPLNPPITT